MPTPADRRDHHPAELIPRWARVTQNTIAIVMALALACLLVSQLAALQRMTGWHPSSRSSFTEIREFLENVSQALQGLIIPAAILGVCSAAGLMLTGNPSGASTLVKVGLATGLVMLAPTIVA